MTYAPDQIREWLEREGRKQKWLAREVPTTPQVVCAWLAGSYVPMAPARRRIQDITGLPVADGAVWAKPAREDDAARRLGKLEGRA